MITDQDVTKLKKTFATKKDLDALRYEVGDLRAEVGEIKDSLESVHDKLDKFLGNYERLDSESNVCTVVQRRHTQQIEGLAQHTGFILPA